MKIILGFIVFIMASTSFAGTCGDVNGDDKLNLIDVSHIINFLYRHGPAPDCGVSYEGVCGDVSGDGKLNLLDISHIIDYLYRAGTGPFCSKVTDIDGNVYKTIKIGDQIWMAENLKVAHYRNGDAIPNITDDAAWAGLTTGAYCSYNNDVNNFAAYGGLYNWHAAGDSRNIAPEGWHTPSDEEWKQMEMYLGMSQASADTSGFYRGDDEGGKLKESGTIHWNSPNTYATNESGFTGLPGGYRINSGTFNYMGYIAFFWSSTECDNENSWDRHLNYQCYGVNRNCSIKQLGFSIRCVKDRGPTVSTAAVSNITATTAQCGGTVIFENDAMVTERGVCWSTSPTPTIADNKTSDGAGIGSFVSSITNLTGGTNYYIRAYATNSFGTGYGNIEEFTTNPETVTDIDGNIYKTIKIGEQVWMAENLKVTHYQNGDAIPNETDAVIWDGLTTGAYCEYDNDINNVATYGRLYNWFAATDNRIIAPSGWHVPNDAEWQQLEMYLDMSQAEADAINRFRGTDEGGKLKETGTTHWISPNAGATNESGFSGLPGGERGYSGENGYYFGTGITAWFWFSTESVTDFAGARALYYNGSGIYRGLEHKQCGFAIRCVKD